MNTEWAIEELDKFVTQPVMRNASSSSDGAVSEGVIKKLNVETQNNVGRRDVAETDLFKQAFSLDEAKPGKARLLRMTDDGSNTCKSVQRGAMAFAEWVFAGIRNPLSHEADQELSEQEALDYLASLSVLARWVDGASVEAFS